MKTFHVLGIMSGTSVDGVDYALCSVNDREFKLSKLWSVAYPGPLRNRIHRAASNRCSSYEVAQLHHDLGRFYAHGARRGLARRAVNVVGLHGQTVFHNPDKKNPATLQIGESAYLVEALRCPVINNFRVADMAAGGQAAPLATLFHKVIFGAQGEHVCVNNLGGISNVTSIDWSRSAQPKVLSFDTGPANVLMDLGIRHFTRGKQHYDEDGNWADRGIPSERLLGVWLKHPYFAKTPPKSTGRELFGESFFKRALQDIHKTRTPNGSKLSSYDAIATLGEFSARSIALSYARFLKNIPSAVILSGGGASNPNLVHRIRMNMHRLNPEIQVTTSEAFGWPTESIEAAAFALLAYYRWNNEPGNIPSTTGARHPALLGQLAGP